MVCDATRATSERGCSQFCDSRCECLCLALHCCIGSLQSGVLNVPVSLFRKNRQFAFEANGTIICRCDPLAYPVTCWHEGRDHLDSFGIDSSPFQWILRHFVTVSMICIQILNHRKPFGNNALRFSVAAYERRRKVARYCAPPYDGDKTSRFRAVLYSVSNQCLV